MNGSNKINLQQMQAFFEGQVDNIRTISDLQLSENDFRSLGVKLKSLYFFRGSENDIADYMLSVAVYSVYSLLYGNIHENFSSIINTVLDGSQYKERRNLRMFRETYDVFGLKTYGTSSPDMRGDCQTIVARHAGVPDSEKYHFYELLSNYQQCEEEAAHEYVYNKFPHRTRYIFGLMDAKNKRSVLNRSIKLVCDAVSGEYTRDELLERYPDLSINLIDSCIMWADSKSEIRICI